MQRVHASWHVSCNNVCSLDCLDVQKKGVKPGNTALFDQSQASPSAWVAAFPASDHKGSL
ncbi:unnamed protein product [Musa acuminata var. zebrina]